MRRHEREVTDISEINDVLKKSFVLHIGFNDGGRIYVVPVNFGFEEKSGAYFLYFHGARAGRKFELIHNGVPVGFECEADCALKTGSSACEYSAYYSSVIGEGTVFEIEDLPEKKRALDLILEKTAGKSGWEYPPSALEKTGVFKICVTSLSCKANRA